MSDFRIVRDLKTGTSPVLGRIFAGPLTIQSLEPPWLDNAPEVSCIPEGRYEVKMTYSNRFKGPMPEITNVHARTGIRIHPGVRVENTEGCVVVGTNRATPKTLEGQVPAFGIFYSWLEHNLAAGPVFVEVSYNG